MSTIPGCRHLGNSARPSVTRCPSQASWSARFGRQEQPGQSLGDSGDANRSAATRCSGDAPNPCLASRLLTSQIAQGCRGAVSNGARGSRIGYRYVSVLLNGSALRRQSKPQDFFLNAKIDGPATGNAECHVERHCDWTHADGRISLRHLARAGGALHIVPQITAPATHVILSALPEEDFVAISQLRAADQSVTA